MERYTWEDITPEMALDYLSHNRPNNRIIRNGTVEKYKRDMLNGRWNISTTDNKITFNEDGELIDGQHRLTAIVKAGIPVRMRVYRDVDNSAVVFDRGATRTTLDRWSMSGQYPYLTAQVISCAKGVYRCLFNKNPTDDEVGSLLEKDYDRFYLAHLVCRRGTTTAICRKVGCMTAAFFALKDGVREDDLFNFFEIANTGLPNASQNFTPALVLRNQIQGYSFSGGYKQNTTLLNITTQAIWDYVHGTPRKLMYKVGSRKYEDAMAKAAQEYMKEEENGHSQV